MADLRGKKLLVTGSGAGIGAAIAAACVERGAIVMIHDLDEGRVRTTARQLGSTVSYTVRDLRSPAECERLVEDAVQHLDGLDGLVNNAAVMTRSDLSSTNHEVFDQVIAVNLKAPLLIIRAAMRHLAASGAASIVNIGSVNAHCGEPTLLAYSIAKGGLMTLTRNLANAYAAERVRVNQLNVGWTLTENEDEIFLSQGFPEGWARQVSPAFAPTGALLTPADVARQAAFWLSPDSAPITGVVYEVEQYPIIGRPDSGARLVS